jgi:hypothetical protein
LLSLIKENVVKINKTTKIKLKKAIIFIKGENYLVYKSGKEKN